MKSAEQIAKELAEKAHAGQHRKVTQLQASEWKPEPYVNHPLRVGDKFPAGSLLRIIGYLHDTVEDSDLTLDEIGHRLGLESDLHETGLVVSAVDALTRREGENYLQFILRVKENKLAVQVKLADLSDNMSDLKPGSLLDKYRMAEYILTH